MVNKNNMNNELMNNELMDKVKEYNELMDKRGYALTIYLSDYSILDYRTKDINADIIISVKIIPRDNLMKLYKIINPGLITVSTEFVSGADDDKRFTKFEEYLKHVIQKIKN